MADAEPKRPESDQPRTSQKRNGKRTDSEHVIRKRVPNRNPKRPNDVYITNKSNFQTELGKCVKLLDEGETEIFIHGMGAAVNRAVNLALQIETKYLGTVKVAVNTSTVTVVDDLEPVDDNSVYETRTRQNSAVHIHVFRTALAGVQK